MTLQLPQVNTDFIHTPILWIGEINSLAQGHSVDEWQSGGKFGQLGFRIHALASKEAIFKVSQPQVHQITWRTTAGLLEDTLG